MRDPKDALSFRSIKEIADLCGVSLKTARRYKDGTVCPPPAVLLLLSGDLGSHDQAWAGWRVRGEVLVSPEGWEITVGDVLSVPLMRAQIQTYQLEFRKMREPQIEDQPAPETWNLEELIA